MHGDEQPTLIHEQVQATGAAERTDVVALRRFDVSVWTVFKIVLSLLLVWLLFKLSVILLEIFIALLVTAALDPVVTRLEERGWKRSVAVMLMYATLVGSLIALAVVIAPVIAQEGIDLARNLPDYLARSEPYFRGNRELYVRAERFLNDRAADPTLYFSPALEVGTSVLSFLARALLVLTMSAYLLVDDGERTLFYIYRFLPDAQRLHIRAALPEISRVVSGYVIGQALTSVLFGVFAFGVCWWLGVPQPLLLALLAAVADAIPIVGVFIATIPPALLALTISPSAAIELVVAYTIYQQIENYVIVPRVYKGTMELPAFGVLVAVAIGAQLLGIVGALIALPIAAAIPVIERIWRQEQHDEAVVETSTAVRNGRH